MRPNLEVPTIARQESIRRVGMSIVRIDIARLLRELVERLADIRLRTLQEVRERLATLVRQLCRVNTENRVSHPGAIRTVGARIKGEITLGVTDRVLERVNQEDNICLFHGGCGVETVVFENNIGRVVVEDCNVVGDVTPVAGR